MLRQYYEKAQEFMNYFDSGDVVVLPATHPMTTKSKHISCTRIRSSIGRYWQGCQSKQEQRSQGVVLCLHKAGKLIADKPPSGEKIRLVGPVVRRWNSKNYTSKMLRQLNRALTLEYANYRDQRTDE